MQGLSWAECRVGGATGEGCRAPYPGGVHVDPATSRNARQDSDRSRCAWSDRYCRRALAAQKAIGYQTYVKMLLREA